MFKATLAALGAAALVFAPTAGAKPGPIEQDFADHYWYEICDVLDENHTSNGVGALMLALMESEGFTGQQVVDIVAYTVTEWCPRNMPLLQRFADDYEEQYAGRKTA